MLKRMTCVGACLLIAVIAHAQNKTYTVREGDNLSVIAKRVGVKRAELAKLNKLSNVHQLKPGLTLRIPTLAHSSASAVWGKGGYVVRSGENDWTIAKKLNISIGKLHDANRDVKWARLQPGQVLRLPGKTSQPATAVASAKTGSKPLVKGGYVVKSGDNDWTIAKRYKITPSKLHALNPGVAWTRIVPGDRLVVPGNRTMVASTIDIRTRYAVVNTDGVTIRRGPGITNDAITTVDQSVRVTVLDREAGWYKLKFPKGTVGWVRGDFLKPISAKSAAQTRVAAKKAKKNFVKSSSKVAATNRKSTRSATRNHRSKPSVDVDFSTFNGSGVSAEVLTTAKSMLGTPYRYGRASRSGTDCSGFALQAYRSVGVKLPRTSRQQSRVGAPVSKGSLSKGDLVFFATRGGSRVGHVGIYVGSGKFIHASSGGGRVRVDSLNEGYYKRRYVGARRVKGGSTTVASRHSTRSSGRSAVKKDSPKTVAAKASEPKKVEETKETAAPTPPNTRGADDIIK